MRLVTDILQLDINKRLMQQLELENQIRLASVRQNKNNRNMINAPSFLMEGHAQRQPPRHSGTATRTPPGRSG